MSKKVFAIVLIVCLAVGVAFAEKGDIKVGAQAGYANELVSAKYAEEKGKLVSNGFYAAVSGEYDVTDEIGVKLEAGIDTMGTWKDDSGDSTTAPVNFSFYLGGQYAFEITDEISVAAGLGADMMLGKQFNKDNDYENINARIGVGAEVVGSYAIAKDIDINLGARYGIYFINTDSEGMINFLKDHDYKIFQSGLKIFAGATYAL